MQSPRDSRAFHRIDGGESDRQYLAPVLKYRGVLGIPTALQCWRELDPPNDSRLTHGRWTLKLQGANSVGSGTTANTDVHVVK